MLKHRYIRNILLFCLLFLTIAYCIWKISLLWFVWVIAIGFVFTIYGAFSIQSNYFINAFHSNPKIQKPHIALTFDDGPHEYTPMVLDILKKYQMKATFFCIGKEVERYPEIARRIVAEGHIIANHTFTHTSKMGFLATHQVQEEILQTAHIIEEVTGCKVGLFRPPFGVTNPHIARAIQSTQMTPIGWNVRSLDTVISSPSRLLHRILSQIRPGSIVLLHDTQSTTVDILEQLLINLQKEGYHLVTISELLQIKAYK